MDVRSAAGWRTEQKDSAFRREDMQDRLDYCGLSDARPARNDENAVRESVSNGLLLTRRQFFAGSALRPEDRFLRIDGSITGRRAAELFDPDGDSFFRFL